MTQTTQVTSGKHMTKISKQQGEGVYKLDRVRAAGTGNGRWRN